MPLSDEEQRLLAQLEKSLTEDDPKLAHLMRGSEPRGLGSSRHLVLGVLGFAAGLALLVIGIETHWLVSVAGFIVMAAAAAVGLGLLPLGRTSSPSQKPGSKQHSTASARTGRTTKANGSGSVMDKFEERWRKRQNDGR